ncbi:hypothetical protein AB0929_14305 [Streptomyces massasporeus]|uniref:hypothetical protein n=1 Tax=Streptomyces massasporeus TaxID=67324 RepID=UPI003453959E
MGLRMTWDLEGVGTVSQSAEGMEEAAKWLVDSTERSRRAFDAEWQWQRLMDAALRVREAMLDEGRRNLVRGAPWESTDEGVKVRLAPRGEAHEDVQTATSRQTGLIHSSVSFLFCAIAASEGTQ